MKIDVNQDGKIVTIDYEFERSPDEVIDILDPWPETSWMIIKTSAGFWARWLPWVGWRIGIHKPQALSGDIAIGCLKVKLPAGKYCVYLDHCDQSDERTFFVR